MHLYPPTASESKSYPDKCTCLTPDTCNTELAARASSALPINALVQARPTATRSSKRPARRFTDTHTMSPVVALSGPALLPRIWTTSSPSAPRCSPRSSTRHFVDAIPLRTTCTQALEHRLLCRLLFMLPCSSCNASPLHAMRPLAVLKRQLRRKQTVERPLVQVPLVWPKMLA